MSPSKIYGRGSFTKPVKWYGRLWGSQIQRSKRRMELLGHSTETKTVAVIVARVLSIVRLTIEPLLNSHPPLVHEVEG
jgi:hypothetical protein